MKKFQKTINVQGSNITIVEVLDEDFISLTDLVKNFGDGSLIEQWLRNKNTIEFLGIWEKINNPDFNYPEFEGIKNMAGLNRFTLSVKEWTERTKAKGITAQAGKYGGTFAHKDIAFEFGAWLSPEFKLYLIKEFQRLKQAEAERKSIEWNAQRALSKVNYRIHTDAIAENLIPENIAKKKMGLIFATEADILNLALFGMTAKSWRDLNPDKLGNIRDYANMHQLIVLSNLESIHAEFIKDGMSKSDRLKKLNAIAINQMQTLMSGPQGQIKKLESGDVLSE